jgi:peptidoglycan/xylan/chitin deacetylase (PgdA/CDA1 family)
LNALPLLEKYEIPATMFVAPNFLKTKFYYWDVVTEYIRLDLDLNKFVNILPPLNWKNDKAKLIQEICHFLKWLPLSERDKFTNELRELIPTNSKLNESISLSQEQLLELSKNPLIQIGAHSMNHNPMSSLSKEMQLNEINSSLTALENIIHKKINS